jgi:hypothetical protein
MIEELYRKSRINDIRNIHLKLLLKIAYTKESQ